MKTIKYLTPALSNREGERTPFIKLYQKYRKGLGFNNVKFLCILLTMVVATNLGMFAQDADTYDPTDSVSAITNENYKINPSRYLKNIDSIKIPTGILIDRVRFPHDIGDFNGKSRVKTCEYPIWRKLYQSIKFASNDTTFFTNIKLMNNMAVSMVQSENEMVLIGIINLQYAKINKNALKSSNDNKTDSFLTFADTVKKVFKQKRLIAASIFEKQVHGDKIKFLISPQVYFTNDTAFNIKQIDIDFGNSEGYQKVYFNNPVNITYKGSSGYVLAKVKITLVPKDSADKKEKVLYSHFTFLRTGTDLIPGLTKLTSTSSLKSAALAPSTTIQYPAGSSKGTWTLRIIRNITNQAHSTVFDYSNADTTLYTDETTNYQYNAAVLQYIPCTTRGCTTWTYTRTDWVRNAATYKIDAAILWGVGNSSGKLRKPIIIVDAVDYRNTRDYYADHIEYDIDPKKYDCRGLYQIIDGQPSAWYSLEQPAGMVNALLTAGYDLVFANFANGTGDLEQTADTLSGFLSSMINGSQFRDEQTEENILIGPSMAGMVTRLALTKMEKAGIEHYSKTWIAFDTPQKGAYIPIALQWAIYYLSRRPTIDLRAGAVDMLLGKLDFLNTPAAKQMLIQQYTYMGEEPAAITTFSAQNLTNNIGQLVEFNQMQARLNTLGYPRWTRNLAITNGGTSKLYKTDGSQILNFDNIVIGLDHGFKGYGNYNDGSLQHKLFEGFWDDNFSGNDYFLYTNNEIGWENAPGGWHSDLYTTNQDDGNPDGRGSATDTCYQKATFMVTASAFGLDVTNDNVYKTWTQFSANQTPFDDILGVTGISEEHVKVSAATKTNITTFLREDRKLLQRPRPHNNGTTTETVSKPLILQSDSVAILGSADGKAGYTIKPGAKVSVYAPVKIRLLPGAKCLKGATFKAKIQSAPAQKAAIIQKPSKGIDYSMLSPWYGKIYAYTDNMAETLVVNTPIGQETLSIYPNPTKGILNFSFAGTANSMGRVTIYNMFGQQVYNTTINASGIRSIDISALPNAVYMLKVNNGNIQKQHKLIKN